MASIKKMRLWSKKMNFLGRLRAPDISADRSLAGAEEKRGFVRSAHRQLLGREVQRHVGRDKRDEGWLAGERVSQLHVLGEGERVELLDPVRVVPRRRRQAGRNPRATAVPDQCFAKCYKRRSGRIFDPPKRDSISFSTAVDFFRIPESLKDRNTLSLVVFHVGAAPPYFGCCTHLF
jgi:hypothetical protein